MIKMSPKAKKKKEYTSHIIERMKLANPNRSRIIPSQGG